MRLKPINCADWRRFWTLWSLLALCLVAATPIARCSCAEKSVARVAVAPREMCDECERSHHASPCPDEEKHSPCPHCECQFQQAAHPLAVAHDFAPVPPGEVWTPAPVLAVKLAPPRFITPERVPNGPDPPRVWLPSSLSPRAPPAL